MKRKTAKSKPKVVPWSALAIGAILWLAYIAGRSALVTRMPYADWPGYFRLEAWMTLLRGICFLLVLGLSLLTLGPRRIGFGLDGGRLGWRVWPAGAWMLLAWAAFFWAPAAHAQLNWRPHAGEFLVAIVVAANEEIFFRGLLFEGFQQRLGFLWAALLSSAFFTAMHLGMEPASNLPALFLMAMILCHLRGLGASILSLVILHLAMDGTRAVLMPQGDPGLGWYYLLGAMLLWELLVLDWFNPVFRPLKIRKRGRRV
jgi:membrane protease YdiL (CAAX protease family)